MKANSPRSSAAIAVVLAVSGACVAFSQDAQRKPSCSPIADSPEAAYLAENNTAMEKMMADMQVEPSGDVDRDFVAMMTPHHKGAIDMAIAVLKYGENEQLKRIAQEIIVDQQQEIGAMKLAIGETLPPSEAASTKAVPQNIPHGSVQSMDSNMKM
jgi:hypothetical protein